MSSDFRVISKLGEGSFAQVFKVKMNRTNKYYAVKRLKKRYSSIEEVQRLPELLSLQHLQGHPHVIELVDMIYDNKNGFAAMVFELMDCNLYELGQERKRPFDERTALILSCQLLSAVAFMHSKNMFHRDIKPENCMINRDTMLLKLADFGSTRGVANAAPYTEYVATRWYRAPECILTSGSYGPEVDEWAVGCMIYELLTSRPLFPGKHEVDQISRIHAVLGTPSGDVLAQFSRNPNTQISLKFPERGPTDFHKLLPRRISEPVIDLMLKLLVYNPQDRISAGDALQHPAFAEIRDLEMDWRASDQNVPFSHFFLNQGRVPVRFAVEQQPQPIVSGEAKPAVTESEKLPKLAHGPIIAKPKVGGLDGGLIESRIKAGQRIKEWQEKKAANMKMKKPIAPPFLSVAYHLSTPGVNAQFEKPRPELLLPVLPKLAR
jgi:renal tumor antigen